MDYDFEIKWSGFKEKLVEILSKKAKNWDNFSEN